MKTKEQIKEYKKQYYKEHKEEIKEYLKDNKEQIKQKSKEYYQNHKEERKQKRKEHYQKHKDEAKQYQKDHKQEINKYQKQYKKTRRQNDPVFKLRQIVSRSILKMLKNNSSSKNGSSILNYLGYTIQELKDYIESQFESWMTWSNHGKYNSDTWNDDDQSTWTWNLDHITAHSTFNYTSMEDDNFKKCWSLDNLRPYSAKQNVIDGDRK